MVWDFSIEREFQAPLDGVDAFVRDECEALGRSESAPVIFGTQDPDTGNMAILAAYGTDEPTERWLWPPFRQDIWSAFSMTEPEGGSDPSQFRTRAVLDGRDVLSGYEPHVGVWPTSYAPTRVVAAREKYASVLAHDPELAAAADAVERDLFARG